MKVKSFGRTGLSLAFALTLTALTALPATAQSRINDKVARNNGAGFWANQRTSRNIQHAQDYSRSIGSYTTQAPAINPVVTQSESQMLGMQLQSIQLDMGIVREAHAANPQVVAQVKVIGDKLAKATESQKMLHDECCKDSPDGKTCGDMAKKLTATLDEISYDHAQLMKMTGDENILGQERTK